MDGSAFWFLTVGVLFLAMGFVHSFVKKLPLSTSLIYLVVGFLLGPSVFNKLNVQFASHSHLIEFVSELVLIVSVFAAGLKLTLPLRDRHWVLVLKLAILSMIIFVVELSVLGTYGLGLPLGAAVLLAAILAPTDPVLASDVQVQSPGDEDRLRFSLTGEAGFNDTTAFPLVVLGLGLMGLHELGPSGSTWLVHDVAWPACAAVGIGWLCGWAMKVVVLRFRRRHKETAVLDDFLGFGLLAVTYGLALATGAYGFLAVFIAGLAFQRLEAAGIENEERGDAEGANAESTRRTVRSILGFHEQAERIGELATVLLVGNLLSSIRFDDVLLWIVPFVFFVARPLSVYAVTGARNAGPSQTKLIAWFGIRGIGSIYYLAYAANHGVSLELVERLSSPVLAAVAFSILLHGISVTPLMKLYDRKGRFLRRKKQLPPEEAY